jgi:hypothetical protein
MDKPAKVFLVKDIEESVRVLRTSIFDIIDSLKADDADNFDSLKSILKDEELAKKFILFQENKNKMIRKKILDGTGDVTRSILSYLEDYEIEFADHVELKGIIKKEKE